MIAKTRMVLGVATLVVGAWIFVFPVIAPSIGMALNSPYGKGSPGKGSSGMSGMTSSGIVYNHATVFASAIPGVLITVLGVYLLVEAFDNRRQQASVMS